MKLEELAALKAELRKTARSARRVAHAASPGAARAAAAHAFREIAGARQSGAAPAAAISGYVAFRDEIDPLPLMHLLHGFELTVALPVVGERAQALRFRRWRPGERMQNGAYGVPIPVTDDPVEPQVIIVPLLAFDSRGHRLGYGGGYYDRTIAELRRHRPVRTIGYALAAQQIEAVPHGPHDMILDCVVTERGIVRPAP